jgi:hypothetical protein
MASASSTLDRNNEDLAEATPSQADTERRKVVEGASGGADPDPYL